MNRKDIFLIANNTCEVKWLILAFENVTNHRTGEGINDCFTLQISQSKSPRVSLQFARSCPATSEEEPEQPEKTVGPMEKLRELPYRFPSRFPRTGEKLSHVELQFAFLLSSLVERFRLRVNLSTCLYFSYVFLGLLMCSRIQIVPGDFVNILLSVSIGLIRPHLAFREFARCRWPLA